ncbi:MULTISPECIES: hypothetical protein [unclassified Leptolyngbya]|uniref:hypothetical protein n=1 Tax=unclassified Leptolyngbya TaxID=2650499 RepID=UPI00168A24F0|nr:MULTISPECIES: hypothetical protein [unclassified Leptolyngbya]MBD1909127.1 hypothetical protein [Leptolyngbya sp. FACHB-8]MBD2157501.1 hypothetical protein [Leptolyngbya sp. FACHB-16]
MIATTAALPHLYKGQKVNFLGGSGTIKSYHPEAGSWSYLVEMEMGPEPEMGRIGYETAILLSQADLILQEDNSLSA